MFALSQLFEIKKFKNPDHSANPDDEITGRNVGSGWGKFAGGVLANLPGMVAGHVVGSELGKNTKYDNTSPLHRMGALIDRKNSATNIAASEGGTLAGGITGGMLASRLGLDGEDALNYILGGAAVGALPGLAMSARAGYKTAKKMGYGTLGKIGASISPLGGLFTPKKEKETQRKNK